MSSRKRGGSPDTSSSSRKRSRIRKVSSSSSSSSAKSDNESEEVIANIVNDKAGSLSNWIAFDSQESNPSQQLATTVSQSESVEKAIIGDIQKYVRSGKILRMQLKNFMCHRNLVVEFNKRANLLVGNNGSGKSAVLAALTIGLGCSANLTNRSSSVKRE